MYGPNAVVPKVNVYTMKGATINSGWSMEECLDLQMVCTVNPKATIWVVEAKSNSVTDLMSAVNYATNNIKADVISMSWGANDDGSIPSSLANNFTSTSVCYCAASGDSNNASWPSVLSNCISVGGSTLNVFPNYRSEYTWNKAGSGYSTSVLQPSYQDGLNLLTKRCIPDLSLIANPNTSVYVVYNGAWICLGGTSVATPIFAGIVSLMNQARFNVGKASLTSVIPAPLNLQNYLYKKILPDKTKYSQNFNDFIIGTNNGSSISQNSLLVTYSTKVGYDIASGLGSPNAGNLCKEILNL